MCSTRVSSPSISQALHRRNNKKATSSPPIRLRPSAKAQSKSASSFFPALARRWQAKSSQPSPQNSRKLPSLLHELQEPKPSMKRRAEHPESVRRVAREESVWVGVRVRQ